MNKKEAKELCLEIWRYFRDNPEIMCKTRLPDELWSKINGLKHQCPLCEVFQVLSLKVNHCSGCPLSDKNGTFCKCIYDDNSPFSMWRCALYIDERQQAASDLVKQIEAWNI